MSDQKHDSKKASPEDARDQKNARRRHRERFRVQLLGWGIKLVLAAICYPLQYVAVDKYTDCTNGSLHTLVCNAERLALFIPSLVLFGVLVGNWEYQRRSLHAWEVAIEKAQQFVLTSNVMEGYTSLFSIYVRTKRRSYHVMTWGLLALLYALVGAATTISESSHGLLLLSWLSCTLELILAMFLLALAYFLGSAYAPGDVIVRHTIALLNYATSDARDQAAASEKAKQAAEPFVRENPWWFYSG